MAARMQRVHVLLLLLDGTTSAVLTAFLARLTCMLCVMTCCDVRVMCPETMQGRGL